MTISDEILEARTTCDRIVERVSEVFVGNQPLVRKLLVAGIANGHVLFEDNPGLGKTLLAKVFARCTGCGYSRVQFTPDLLPADIIGTNIWNQRDSSFSLIKGPVFTNILLADEINRSPPKTQAALLEATEEHQVSIEGVTHTLEPPFFVLATQNPIEQEGTYPLPEAQMDRFMFRLSTGYASSRDEEALILSRRIDWQKDDPTGDVEPVVTQDQFRHLGGLAESSIYVDPQILSYVAEMIRGTREHPRVSVGSSPRGGLALVKAARAMAVTYGRDFVTPDDIKLISTDTLAHRLILNIEDVLEGVSEESIVEEVVSQVEVPTEFQRRP